MRLFHLAAAVASLSALEAVLVALGVLPPVLSYSPGNILFSLAKLVTIACAGVIFAQEGLKKSALNGAILGGTGAASLCIFSLLGSILFGKIVLGLPPVNIASLVILLAFTIITNAVLGTIVAAIAGFIAIRTRKPNKRK
ncbi:MAG: hypothetical protein V1861_04070 [Candidatus Micrarchaeota archaeon]